MNYGGNRDPQMLVCLHEEHAVAIAHGYAKVTGRPMAVAIHGNVGLMHAIMAMYNAYCDRVPMLIVGATGPVDAARRRPWIDWIHTSADQGALIRQFSKWDDQPASVEAALDSLALAYSLTGEAPSAPVYVCLDVSLQERPLPTPPVMPDARRDRSPAVARARRGSGHGPHWSFSARRAGRCSCSAACGGDEQDWDRRVALAERYGALVISDLKNGAVFPTEASAAPEPARHLPARLLRRADRRRGPDPEPGLGRPGRDHRRGGRPRPSGLGADHLRHDGLRAAQRLVEGFVRTRSRLTCLCPPIPTGWYARCSDRTGRRSRREWPGPRAAAAAAAGRHPGPDADGGDSGIVMHDLAEALRGALAGSPACLVRVPLGWSGADLQVDHPLDFLGMDGGAGIGSGPGMAVGAALALAGSERLPVAVLGDGDFLMGGTAVWTAAHYRLPLLIVVANNSSFYNDVVHQERMAVQRGRPAGTPGSARPSPIPIRTCRPSPVRSAGARPIRCATASALPAALTAAATAARSGQCVLVDVRVRPDGYAASNG